MDRRAVIVLAAAGLGGCAGVAPPAPTAAPRNAAELRAAAPSALTAERKWLQSWFEGTPVRIDQQRDGPVDVEVPQPFGFDEGRDRIKPPLAAVLDKVAQSLVRMPTARLTLVAAPADPAKAEIGMRRAEAIRRHLGARGVAAERIGKPSVASTAGVRLRIEADPA